MVCEQADNKADVVPCNRLRNIACGGAMNKEYEETLLQQEEEPEISDADCEADAEEFLHDGDLLQADSRPAPANSKELWAKMLPEDHYHRLLRIDDIEAWQHLGDLIWVHIARHHSGRIYNILRRGGRSHEDMVRSIMVHIFRKIREGTLHLSEPGKFYGLLKSIIFHCLCDVLRQPRVEDAIVDLGGEEERLLPDSSTPEQAVEQKFMTDLIWRAVIVDAPIKNPKHRRALELSLKMEMGIIDLKNNQELAERLSLELGEAVSYAQAASWVHSGKEILQQYLVAQGFEKK